MEIVLLWLLFGFFSAMIASGKNRSTFGWFLVGILVGPFGLLVAFMPKIEDQGSVKPEAASGTRLSMADELEKLSKLKESGVISEKEFEIQKKKLLS